MMGVIVKTKVFDTVVLNNHAVHDYAGFQDRYEIIFLQQPSRPLYHSEMGLQDTASTPNVFPGRLLGAGKVLFYKELTLVIY